MLRSIFTGGFHRRIARFSRRLPRAFRGDPNDRTDVRQDAEMIAIMRRVMARGAHGVDVGAFKGTFVREMIKIAPQGRHLAVEPLPAYAERLRRRFPQVRVAECALGDERRTVEFIEALDTPPYSGLTRQQYPTDRERTRAISVRMDRLDDLVTRETPVSFIKIDVEGAEYVVLRGGMETIRRDQPVIAFEYGRAGRESGTTSEMMWRLLHDDLGLELSLMRTWLEGGLPYTATGFGEAVDAGADWMFVASPAR